MVKYGLSGGPLRGKSTPNVQLRVIVEAFAQCYQYNESLLHHQNNTET